MYGLIFPGQGSQSIGMGREVFDTFSCAKEVFQEVDEVLQQNLSRLIFEGSLEELTLTENTQPALMAVSLAIMRVLEKEGGFDLAQKVFFVAGHSLGEYVALAAAGAFSIQEAAQLLRIRGQAMQKAVPVGQGAMAALLGVDVSQAQIIAEQAAEGQICVIANDNGGGQVVLSGHRTAIERAVEIAPTQGAKKGILLPVSAPFHCPLMQPAAIAMEDALTNMPPRTPIVPLVANVTAVATTSSGEIKTQLVEQVTGRVRWRESVEFMADQGVTTLIEVGAGKVLTGLTKRIRPEMRGLSLNTPHDIDSFLKNLA